MTREFMVNDGVYDERHSNGGSLHDDLGIVERWISVSASEGPTGAVMCSRNRENGNGGSGVSEDLVMSRCVRWKEAMTATV